MKLSRLLERISYAWVQGPDVDVAEIANDSRLVVPGSLFFCVKGAVSDGHAFVADVIGKGAAALVVQDEVEAPPEVAVIRVEDTRYAMAWIAAAWYGYPAEKLKVIGVTGTKGKTTTTYLIQSILEAAGHKTGLIGTIEAIVGDDVFPAKNTTPESLTIQRYFAQMVEQGCDSAVMEVSSQGLKLHRTAAIPFEIGIFTNLEPDHIGPAEHEDFADYLQCKSRLFRQCRLGVVNADDRHVGEILEGHTCDVETYGFSPGADFRAVNAKLVSAPGMLGIYYHVTGKREVSVEVDIPGKFSIYNSLAAIAVCDRFGVGNEEMVGAIRKARVKGRIEMVKVSDAFTLMIDYAHNAMALESLLTTLREYEPKRLVCVFGCGGNRAKSRRFEMGEVSGKYADFTIITSDNPRFEEPMDIIGDIVTGIQKTSGAYITIPDRKEAIAYAIRHGQPGDVIVLAGKGHEDYQEIRGVKYPMDERVLIKEILEEGA